MPHHPSIDFSAYELGYQPSYRPAVRAQPQEPLPPVREEGRSSMQSPPPPAPPVPTAPDLSPAALLPTPPLNPRSKKAQEKQRAVSPERNTALSYEHGHGGIATPSNAVGKKRPQGNQYESSFSFTPQDEPITRPTQSQQDPSHFYLPDIRKKEISGPLQPRITDLSAGVQRDQNYSNPTFEVDIRFRIKMEPHHFDRR